MPVAVGICAFFSEYLDSALGMGYGTALAPLLIIMGYSPAQVVPAILLSQLFTDIAACISHHRLRNVNLKFSSRDFKIAGMFGLISLVGVIISVFFALRIPAWAVKTYIGLLVCSMGLLLLFTINKPMRFSWPKIAGASLLASFNKGISGGGYGPLLMGGQMLSGVYAKNAVGITAFAEAVTCFAGFILYIIMGKSVDWKLSGLLSVCAVAAVPIAALTVKHINALKLKKYIGWLIIVLGLFTLLK